MRGVCGDSSGRGRVRAEGIGRGAGIPLWRGIREVSEQDRMAPRVPFRGDDEGKLTRVRVADPIAQEAEADGGRPSVRWRGQPGDGRGRTTSGGVPSSDVSRPALTLGMRCGAGTQGTLRRGDPAVDPALRARYQGHSFLTRANALTEISG